MPWPPVRSPRGKVVRLKRDSGVMASRQGARSSDGKAEGHKVQVHPREARCLVGAPGLLVDWGVFSIPLVFPRSLPVDASDPPVKPSSRPRRKSPEVVSKKEGDSE